MAPKAALFFLYRGQRRTVLGCSDCLVSPCKKSATPSYIGAALWGHRSCGHGKRRRPRDSKPRVLTESPRPSRCARTRRSHGPFGSGAFSRFQSSGSAAPPRLRGLGRAAPYAGALRPGKGGADSRGRLREGRGREGTGGEGRAGRVCFRCLEWAESRCLEPVLLASLPCPARSRPALRRSLGGSGHLGPSVTLGWVLARPGVGAASGQGSCGGGGTGLRLAKPAVSLLSCSLTSPFPDPSSRHGTGRAVRPQRSACICQLCKLCLGSSRIGLKAKEV